MIDRRRFISGIAIGLAAAWRPAQGQTAPRKKDVRRIGALLVDTPPGVSGAAGEWTRLKKLGWIEGENLIIERRWAYNKPELLPQLATELVRLKVDVIVTFGTDATIAAKNATSSIPIVMVVGDPIAIGVVSNLARPGGNITGLSLAGTELITKRVALLQEMLPAVQRVGLLLNPTTAAGVWRRGTEQAYRAAGLRSFEVEVRDANGLEAAVAEVARRGGQAVEIFLDPLFLQNSATITAAALRNRLPTMVPLRGMVEAGGLMAYRPYDEPDIERLAAMTDKILRGAKPGEIAIEQPMHFELYINLKTAKALGITVPQSLLARADEVIQ
jgi:putative ABC transport system substrate-binding protein